MFIRVTDVQHNDCLIINTDNISFISENARVILLNGTHYGGVGLVRVSDMDISKILNNISVVD